MTFTNANTESSNSDRRTAGRIKCSNTVCQFGDVMNLSRGGCRVVAKRPVDLPEGRTANMQINAMGSKVIVPVRLVSCRQRPDGRYECGFQFMGVDEDMRREIVRFARAAANNEVHWKAA